MYVFPLEYIFIKDIKILSGNVLFHTLHVRIISGEKHDPIYIDDICHELQFIMRIYKGFTFCRSVNISRRG